VNASRGGAGAKTRARPPCADHLSVGLATPSILNLVRIEEFRMATKQVTKRNVGTQRPNAQSRSNGPNPRQQVRIAARNAARRLQQRGGQNGNAVRLGPAGGSQALAGKGSTRNSLQSTNRQHMTVEEDEYIAEVTVANQPNFNNVQYSVNPGQVGTFPWLATVAQRFEKYRFDYLEFYYKREVSEYATNGQVGKVMMSFDTDAADAPPTTKQQIEDTMPHVDSLPSENMRLRIDESLLYGKTDAFYVRPGALPGSADIKTYDIGNLNVATSGIVNNVAVGELHVRYRVHLLIPVLEAGAGGAVSLKSAFFQSTSPEASGATTVAKNVAFATATSNGLGVVNTTGSLVPPAGTYAVDVTIDSCNGTSTAMQGSVVDLQKNGATVMKSAPIIIAANNNTAVSSINASVFATISAIVTANGTDAFTVPVINDFTAGTQTVQGTIRFLSV